MELLNLTSKVECSSEELVGCSLGKELCMAVELNSEVDSNFDKEGSLKAGSEVVGDGLASCLEIRKESRLQVVS